MLVQPPAAAHAADGKDRHPGRAERLHVPMDRPAGDLEAGGQLAPALLAVGLEQEENGQESVSLHRRKLLRGAILPGEL